MADDFGKRIDWTLEVVTSRIIPGPRWDGPVGRGLSLRAKHDISPTQHLLALLVRSFCLLEAQRKLIPFHPVSSGPTGGDIALPSLFFNFHDPYSFSPTWISALRGHWDLEVLVGGKEIESWGFLLVF